KGNCGLVVGAIDTESLELIREKAPDLPILIPGIGAQGGNLFRAVTAGMNKKGESFLISVSRDIIYSSSGEDFAVKAREKAKEYRNRINEILSNKIPFRPDAAGGEKG
ncbi:MAG: hypothetical protein ACE5QV_07755, partial [Fidelibacterota bacterium]